MVKVAAKPQYLTFVLGAGASAAYGFPIGDTLVKNVAERMIDETDEYQRHEVHALGKKLSLYHPVSIDSYLSKYYRADIKSLTLYKTYIAAEILSAHEKACCGTKKGFGQQNPNNWMRFLVPELIDIFERHSEVECPIKIVTFNYDLSIEYYFEQIINQFSSDAHFRDAFLRWVSKAIVHVYGHIGCYPWQVEDGPYANYKDNRWLNSVTKCWSREIYLTPSEMMQYAESYQSDIHIIGEIERKKDSEYIALAHEWIENSFTLVFSGYAFDKDNNACLKLAKKSQNVTNVIVGLYNKTKRIEAEVEKLFQPRGKLREGYISADEAKEGLISPGAKVWAVHDHISTYDLFREELVLGELYG